MDVGIAVNRIVEGISIGKYLQRRDRFFFEWIDNNDIIWEPMMVTETDLKRHSTAYPDHLVNWTTRDSKPA